MTQEQIRAIIQLLPTVEEKRHLNTYLSRKQADIRALCECEKFMVAMLNVRHAKRKLNALLFMQKFLTAIEELRNGEFFWSRIDQQKCSDSPTPFALRFFALFFSTLQPQTPTWSSWRVRRSHPLLDSRRFSVLYSALETVSTPLALARKQVLEQSHWTLFSC